jgi:hypothetical protein
MPVANISTWVWLLLKKSQFKPVAELNFSPREALKSVGGKALVRQIFQKKRSLHVVNEHFFGKFNDARASEVIFQSFPSSALAGVNRVEQSVEIQLKL